MTFLKKVQEKYLTVADSKFFNNTDTVDIGDQSIGIHCSVGYKNRGLCIQIRHNREKALFNAANQMAKVIVEALNTANLKLPKSDLD